ncbi:DMT family transporter [Brachyspira pilosicoli]|uniref:DMT family transporter n=1 Tax=Brachyspira pilosicoli TaxID=52584 RepID=UPI003007CC95
MGKGIFLFIGVAALSMSAIFVKLANAPALIVAFYRLLFSFIIILPIVLIKNFKELVNINKKDLLLSLIAGIALSLHYSMWFQSLKYTSVASSTVIVTLQPLFSIIAGYFIFKERYTKLAILGFIIAIVGSVIIGWGDFRVSAYALFGDILAFISAGLMSANFVLGQYVRKRLSAITYTALTYFSASILSFFITIISDTNFVGYPFYTWLNILGLTLISTMLGHVIFMWLLKWFSASVVSMTILGEAVGACILGYFILKESISINQIIGIIVILFGIGLFLKEHN